MTSEQIRQKARAEAARLCFDCSSPLNVAPRTFSAKELADVLAAFAESLSGVAAAPSGEDGARAALVSFVEQAQFICQSGNPRSCDIDELRRRGKVAFPYGAKSLAGGESAPEPPATELLDEACATVYLHGNSRWLTQQMCTPAKDAFADAVDRYFAKDPTSELRVERWWKDVGAAPPAASPTTTAQPLTVCTQHGKAPCEICYPTPADPHFDKALREIAQSLSRDHWTRIQSELRRHLLPTLQAAMEATDYCRPGYGRPVHGGNRCSACHLAKILEETWLTK